MAKRVRGYTCCGGPMVVTATRKPSALLVRRYRQCRICGRRIVTEERIAATITPSRVITDTTEPNPTN